MGKFDIKVSVSVNEVLRTEIFRTPMRKVMEICMRVLEKYLGERIFVPVSQSLQLFGGNATTTWETIHIINKLQSLGIMQNFSKKISYPDEPTMFSYSATYSTLINDRAGGADFFSPKRAIWKTIGESVERHLWSQLDFFSKNQVVRSYREIHRNALNIFSLAGFSEEQKKRHEGLQFNEFTPFAWIPAYSLTKRKEILCPVQLTSALYFWNKKIRTPYNKDAPEPMLRWSITTGLATGKSLEEAIVAGILEDIERDAFMITYLNKLSPPLINFEHLADQDEDISNILKKIKRYNLEVYMILLPTDFHVHVILSLIIDRSGKGPAASVGASADFNLKKCFLDALSEALTVRHFLKHRYKKTPASNYVGRDERLLYWAQKENLKKLDFLTKGKLTKVNFGTSITQERAGILRYNKKQLNVLIEKFIQQKQEVCYVELSSRETRSLGFRTVQVIAPELQPMHLDEIIPYFGGKRLKTVPEKLGYKAAEELNKEPHPFP